MLRFSEGTDCVEILGPFNKKLGEAFQLGGCDPDYCYYYNMRINETFKPGQKMDIQLVVLFDDNYSNRYLRIFNTSLEATNDVSKIFNNAEVDAVAKAMIYKEISLMFRTDFSNVRKNLEDKIINSFKYYRVKEKSGTASNQLILPVSIRYLPLYVDSFLKTGILSNPNNRTDMTNQIIYIMNKLLREPLYSTTKYLYPKFYRIDNIEGTQTNNNNSIKIDNIGLINEKYNIVQKPLLLRLSKDVIDFDCAYLIDNGCYIYLFIFNHIEGNFYNDIFGVPTFEDAQGLESFVLDEENQSDINQRLLNIISQLRKENSGHFQPVRIFLFEERGIINPILTNLLKEDKIEDYDNYPSYLCTIHKEIQSRIIG
jgi:protein transport protein SEC24